MRRFILRFLFFPILFFVIFSTVEARSGCCSHHGGVCGCGCCDGTSLSQTCAPYYPECSGGNSAPQQIYVYPTNTPYIPPPTATSLPTYTSAPTHTPIPTATLTLPPTRAAKKPTQKTVKKQKKKMISPTATPTQAPRKNLFQWLFGI
ncbi:hypothetical protein COU89_03685 [Candidatus Roizmanbacteria bacterium CG10_big_fil_rev_8_21_14_0_10_45_7]|uniref:Uncharacterized protein n=1 Tax=Candidatus Roizmanbacteria bacterium CG10_big_fil_rev_8_21_14_0_10_45_7 TaxID=1974854 RepID=A0A2M8KTX9_9BACT|nr:MAG: hypothetical protein COU89_03685 [Candidatus Roizmanbacteria bacterium CG10_big_fil_rev_8_21_14_0_10_45_7]